jgi:signal transduction histidine kinase
MAEASRHGFKECFIIPFVFDQDVMGFIELFTKKKIVEDLEIKKIFQDISSEIALKIMQQRTEERVASLTRELLSSAKNLGMSQIANSTLHNVGNALNTLTIVASLLEENQDASELKNLPKVASLIKEHRDDLSNFILNDPKGKLLPDYIITLSSWWQKDQEAFQSQLKQVFTSIRHIQKIIRTQQAIDKFGGLKEKISINLLLDDLLGLLSKELNHFGITIRKNYQDLPEVTVERSSLVQILENLLTNAIDALCAIEEDRILTIYTRLIGSNRIQVEVTDNGIGITSAQLEKIFSYGFTLKEAGHGYGLHNSSKLIKELGGELIAKSEGLNRGASFFVSIPLS